MRPLLKFALLGLISGVLYEIFSVSELYLRLLSIQKSGQLVSDIEFALASGGIFSLAIASHFYRKKSLLNIFLFIFMSAFGYFLFFYNLDNFHRGMFNMIWATIILPIGFSIVLGFHLFISKLTIKQFLLLIIYGPILYFAATTSTLITKIINPTILIYQIGMAAALGYCVEQNSQKKSAKKK